MQSAAEIIPRFGQELLRPPVERCAGVGAGIAIAMDLPFGANQKTLVSFFASLKQELPAQTVLKLIQSTNDPVLGQSRHPDLQLRLGCVAGRSGGIVDQIASLGHRQYAIFMASSLRKFWRIVRAATGDDAYERYLGHWHRRHASEGAEPMSRKAFYEAEIRRRWNGVKRCC